MMPETDRRDPRPDWSLLRFVVRTTGRIFENDLTIAAFLERERAEDFASFMTEHDARHGFVYRVEEVAP